MMFHFLGCTFRYTGDMKGYTISVAKSAWEDVVSNGIAVYGSELHNRIEVITHTMFVGIDEEMIARIKPKNFPVEDITEKKLESLMVRKNGHYNIVITNDSVLLERIASDRRNDCLYGLCVKAVDEVKQ